MGLRINNNINSINAARQLQTNNASLSKSLQRLSSGFRINKGSDGPAALIISEKLRAQITGLKQGVENSQAAVNVIVGERYKEVTDQTIQYALGLWGREGGELMDPDVKDKILNRPRAREWAAWRPPNPSVQEVRRKYGGAGVSDEEVVLRAFAGEESVKAMFAAGPPREYLNARQPIVWLVDELTKKKECTQIYVQKPGFALTLEKKNGS